METLAVLGLGYVGLPIAAAWAGAGYTVIGYDHSAARINELKNGHDRTGSISAQDLKKLTLRLLLSDDAAALRAATVFIITVPTPIDAAQAPDLTLLQQAGAAVAAHVKRGDLVVLESTVYPGATEDFLLPILAANPLGLKPGADFSYGYAPERINPGDAARQLRQVVKVLAGDTPQTLTRLKQLYAPICGADNLYAAPSIATAEAAKVLENTQRDVNIALINELALIADRLGLDTTDILDTAATKWNFLRFSPGLVGGHCIGVDPYYLTHRAARAGYIPQVILSGRAVNNSMAAFIADKTLQLLAQHKAAWPPAVTILGVTFKENVPDCRNSQVPYLKKRLEDFGAVVAVVDPLADDAEVSAAYGFSLSKSPPLADAVICAVAHEAFKSGGLEQIQRYAKPHFVLIDVKGMVKKAQRDSDIIYWRL